MESLQGPLPAGKRGVHNLPGQEAKLLPPAAGMHVPLLAECICVPGWGWGETLVSGELDDVSNMQL